MENQKEYSRLQVEINKLRLEKNKVKEENPEVFQKLEQIENAERIILERQDIIKDEILKEYDNNGLKQDNVYEDDIIKIKYSPSYDKTIVDNKKLQTEYEDVYLECLKKSTIKSSLKVTIK